MANKHIDLTGKKFAHLFVNRYLGRLVSNKHTYECICDCGNVVICTAERLTGGYKTSCGCMTKKHVGTMNNESGTRLYRIWIGMKFRCDKGDKYYDKHYVERGIKVCDEWYNNYFAFKEWAITHGYNDKLSIDRIDNYGDYSPDNCRWVTMQEQNNNRTNNRYIEYHGMTKTLAEWSKALGINYWTLIYRFDKLCMTPEEAFNTPIMDKTKNLKYYKSEEDAAYGYC